MSAAPALTEANAFVRVLEMPTAFAKGWVFDPRPATFLEVDWFSLEHAFPAGLVLDDEGRCKARDMIVENLVPKRYRRPDRQLLVLTDYGDAFVVSGVDMAEPSEYLRPHTPTQRPKRFA